MVLGSPLEPTRLVVQRIAALEGDWVRRKAGAGGTTDWRPRNSELIRRGNCWLERDGSEDPPPGDRTVSLADSRAFGQVPLALVEGRVSAVVRVQLGLPFISVTWVS